MTRMGWVGAFLLALVGCQLPDQRQPALLPILPEPERSDPQNYLDLVRRARLEAERATQASYQNNWAEVEVAALGLKRTAVFLSSKVLPDTVPQQHKDKLPIEAGDLGKEVAKLQDAVRARNTSGADQSLTSINRLVRQLDITNP